MDWRTTTHQGSLGRLFAVAGAVFVFLCATLPALADQPPKIRAKGKSQNLTLNNPSQPAIFEEQDWPITAPRPFGPTYAVWTIEPFRKRNDPASQVDSQLNLRMLGRGNRDNWTVLIPVARTRVAQGQTTATVAAGSEGGNGEAGITVSFLGHEQPLLGDGIYEATVIGTITEGF